MVRLDEQRFFMYDYKVPLRWEGIEGKGRDRYDELWPEVILVGAPGATRLIPHSALELSLQIPHALCRSQNAQSRPRMGLTLMGEPSSHRTWVVG